MQYFKQNILNLDFFGAKKIPTFVYKIKIIAKETKKVYTRYSITFIIKKKSKRQRYFGGGKFIMIILSCLAAQVSQKSSFESSKLDYIIRESH